ncbi:MAG: hypothetical protein QF470_06555 [Methylococcales bacterium]|jgi:hypothetical protein|nr:hypothetical protein [Methylococcales bacterium]
MMLKTTLTSDNIVFVGHSLNLRDGFGVWPKPEGVWVIFKKTEQGINYLGMIMPILNGLIYHCLNEWLSQSEAIINTAGKSSPEPNKKDFWRWA